MTTFRVRYRDGRPDELVEAEHVTLEGEAHIVFRKTVIVIGQPREIVCRRIAGQAVAVVEDA